MQSVDFITETKTIEEEEAPPVPPLGYKLA